MDLRAPVTLRYEHSFPRADGLVDADGTVTHTLGEFLDERGVSAGEIATLLVKADLVTAPQLYEAFKTSHDGALIEPATAVPPCDTSPRSDLEKWFRSRDTWEIVYDLVTDYVGDNEDLATDILTALREACPSEDATPVDRPTGPEPTPSVRSVWDPKVGQIVTSGQDSSPAGAERGALDWKQRAEDWKEFADELETRLGDAGVKIGYLQDEIKHLAGRLRVLEEGTERWRP